MVLERLQALLGRIYDVEPPLEVGAFLVTDREQVRDWRDGGGGSTDEALFLREGEGELELALYVDAAVLGRLAQRDPFDGLGADNLQDCCTALEGVSHLLYLAWCALRGRSVSLLELETQAEVDKFAALLVLAGGGAAAAARLHSALFERVSFAEGLDAERLARYRDANRLAGRYCRRLARRWLRARDGGRGLFSDLRSFYRLGHGAKLARAAC